MLSMARDSARRAIEPLVERAPSRHWALDMAAARRGESAAAPPASPAPSGTPTPASVDAGAPARLVDTALLVGDSRLWCHRSLLRARSPYFARALADAGTRVLRLPAGTSLAAARIGLDYVYSDVLCVRGGGDGGDGGMHNRIGGGGELLARGVSTSSAASGGSSRSAWGGDGVVDDAAALDAFAATLAPPAAASARSPRGSATRDAGGGGSASGAESTEEVLATLDAALQVRHAARKWDMWRGGGGTRLRAQAAELLELPRLSLLAQHWAAGHVTDHSAVELAAAAAARGASELLRVAVHACAVRWSLASSARLPRALAPLVAAAAAGFRLPTAAVRPHLACKTPNRVARRRPRGAPSPPPPAPAAAAGDGTGEEDAASAGVGGVPQHVGVGAAVVNGVLVLAGAIGDPAGVVRLYARGATRICISRVGRPYDK